ncbi:MAG TPA: agmatine deiminase family protein [Solirubrobacteraceae bacterium]|nr:agmatine deiminase family protein [Solirubrobacteraceae bacterium]
MPAEWAPHERTLMAWPVREELWGPLLADAKRDYAEIARAIVAYEPVLMVARDGFDARRHLGSEVEVVELSHDDSWIRDSGPIFVAGGANRLGIDFAFNGWGGKFAPHDADDALPERLCEYLGIPRERAEIVLEGGSVSVDGEGALVTTEQCLLDPSRNPHLDRDDLEEALVRLLGVERIVWLGRGLVEDEDTDGHVDNVCQFIAPGRVLLQTVADPRNPNHANLQDNLERARAAGLEVVELDLLPSLGVRGRPGVVSYTNFYVCNGAVMVPVADQPTDADALERIGACFPDREVVPVPGAVLAEGGGGPHCITQEVPA